MAHPYDIHDGDPDELPSGARLGPYRICTRLGAGGMATVYLARRDDARGAHRFVALKRVHPRLRGDPTFAALFLDEARIASMLQHPHVCGLIDYDATIDTYYLVLEYLRGEPFASIHRGLAKQKDRGADWPVIARMVADAAEGLHAAHELRDDLGRPLHVVHRDVSLDNVYLTFDGVVKLLDFGVAKAADQQHRTSTGILMGKHAYMAPEALRGRRPDRRVDVWSLGVVLWELCTGKRLFRRSTEVDTLRAVLEVKVVPPSSLRPSIPKELDEVVLKALARDPAKRFVTARAMGRALMGLASAGASCPSFGDLADWLAVVCPGAEARKREILASASTSDERSAGDEGRPSGERSIPIDLSAGPIAPAPPVVPDELETTPTHPWAPPPRPSRRWIATAGLGVATALASGTVGWTLAPRDAAAERGRSEIHVLTEHAGAPRPAARAAAADPREAELACTLDDASPR